MPSVSSATPTTTSRVLAAVRKAGASITGPFALRSEAFRRLRRRHASLNADLDAVCDALDQALYDLVPQQPDAESRGQIIDLKRDVHNRREADPDVVASLPDAVRADAERYVALLDERRRLRYETSDEIVTAQRTALERLTETPRFRAAVAPASPGLWNAVEHADALADGRPERPFRKRDTSLYAYASRFMGKANPLHLFAEVALPSLPQPSASEDAPSSAIQCEVVRSVRSLVEAEYESASRADNPYLAVPPNQVEADETHALVLLNPTHPSRQLIRLKLNPVLHALLDTLSQGARRRADVERDLEASFPSLDAARRTEFVDTLLSKGILTAHLVDDLNQDTWPTAQHVPHLSKFDVEDGPAVVEALEAEDAATTTYVNTYVDPAVLPDALTNEATFGDVTEALRRLKPVFQTAHNGTPLQHTLRRAVREVLDAEGGEMSYLNLYRQVRGQDLDAEWPAAAHTLRRTCAAHTGTLTDDALDALLTDATDALADVDRPERVCFNGPFDAETATFYPTNVWNGDGHFTTRYRPDQSRAVPSSDVAGTDADGADAAGRRDVQLYGPAGLDMNYTAVVCTTGVTLRGRYRSMFDDWLPPGAIHVRLRGDAIEYVDGRDGTPLNVRYVGYAQSHQFPLELRLLLLNHADVYHNPFSAYATSDEAEDVETREGLTYRSVCLRRRRHYVRARALPETVHDEPFVGYAVRLTAWIASALEEATRFYFRVLDDEQGRKPRLLDLDSPLSIASFLRRVRQLDGDGVIVFEPMQPDVDGLFRINDQPFVTEVMLDV